MLLSLVRYSTTCRSEVRLLLSLDSYRDGIVQWLEQQTKSRVRIPSSTPGLTGLVDVAQLVEHHAFNMVNGLKIHFQKFTGSSIKIGTMNRKEDSVCPSATPVDEESFEKAKVV